MNIQHYVSKGRRTVIVSALLGLGTIFSSTSYAAELVDLDNDGDLDALYATPSSSSGYSGAQMLAYDLASKKMLWQILTVMERLQTLSI